MANISHVTAATQVVATSRRCHLLAVYLTAGSDAATVVIKNGDSSGTTIATLKAAANTSAPPFVVHDGGVPCGGIYVDVTGTSPAVMVEYD